MLSLGIFTPNTRYIIQDVTKLNVTIFLFFLWFSPMFFLCFCLPSEGCRQLSSTNTPTSSIKERQPPPPLWNSDLTVTSRTEQSQLHQWMTSSMIFRIPSKFRKMHTTSKIFNTFGLGFGRELNISNSKLTSYSVDAYYHSIHQF